jgi:hypothetical protein
MQFYKLLKEKSFSSVSQHYKFGKTLQDRNQYVVVRSETFWNVAGGGIGRFLTICDVRCRLYVGIWIVDVGEWNLATSLNKLVRFVYEDILVSRGQRSLEETENNIEWRVREVKIFSKKSYLNKILDDLEIKGVDCIIFTIIYTNGNYNYSDHKGNSGKFLRRLLTGLISFASLEFAEYYSFRFRVLRVLRVNLSVCICRAYFVTIVLEKLKCFFIRLICLTTAFLWLICSVLILLLYSIKSIWLISLSQKAGFKIEIYGVLNGQNGIDCIGMSLYIAGWEFVILKCLMIWSLSTAYFIFSVDLFRDESGKLLEHIEEYRSQGDVEGPPYLFWEKTLVKSKMDERKTSKKTTEEVRQGNKSGLEGGKEGRNGSLNRITNIDKIHTEFRSDDNLCLFRIFSLFEFYITTCWQTSGSFVCKLSFLSNSVMVYSVYSVSFRLDTLILSSLESIYNFVILSITYGDTIKSLNSPLVSLYFLGLHTRSYTGIQSLFLISLIEKNIEFLVMIIGIMEIMVESWSLFESLFPYHHQCRRCQWECQFMEIANLEEKNVDL